MKCIDDEIPFEIPQSWCWCRFSAIYRLLTDGTHNTPKYTEIGIPFISVKDMSSGKLSFSNTKFISEEEHKILSARCCPEYGDLLISKVGTTGIPLIIDTDKEFSIFVSLALIKFFPNHIDSNFLIHLINSPLVQEQVKRDTRGVGNKNWVLTAISNTLLAIPPLVEQKRIVSKIEEIMPIADKYEKSQEALDRLNTEIYDKLKKSVLQEAIQGKLVPQNPNDEPASVLLKRIKEEKAKLFKEGKLKKKDLVDSVIFKGDDNKYYEKVGSEINCIDDEIPFEIPSSWQWVRLGKVTIVNPRNTISDEMSVGFIPMTNISPGYGNSIECEQRYWKDVKSGFTHIAEGDVAFAKITPCFQNRKSFIAANLPNGFAAGTTELNVLRPYDNTIDTRYLLWFLKSEYFISEAKFKGTAGQQRVVTDYVLNRLFPLPPVKEQIRISNHLEFVIASIMRR